MHTLLLADDSVTTQRVIALTFADESFRVVTVSDGQQAIDAMAAARPDIVLAGTTLPRTNGYELAEHMRSQQRLRDVPLLLLSGAFESVDEARLKASGARGVIEKPLEPTAVISRVRALLGFKDTRPAAAAGRLVTTADGPADRRAPGRQAPPPVHKPPVSSWDELRQESGLAPDARSVEGGASGAGREDYLDTLDAAFDSLDQHLSGRASAAHPPRNPSPPLGQASGAPDPRSPGRRPSPRADGTPANSVFEADSDWFTDDPKAADTADRDDMMVDAHAALPARPDTATASPIFEVDDEWFAEDEKAREARRAQERELAAEMGIHDVELPSSEPVPDTPAPASDLDFDFGLDDLLPAGGPKAGPDPDSPFAPPPAGPTPAPRPAPPAIVTPPAPAVVTPAPVAITPIPVVAAPVLPAPVAPAAVAPASASARPQAGELRRDLAEAASGREGGPVAPLAPISASHSMADDFAALLAFETGDAVREPDPPAVVEVQVVTPEITEGMLDQIADRVAERLTSGAFGTQLLEAMPQPLPPPEAIAPEITDAMLQQIAQQVTDRLNSGDFATQLRDAIAATVRDTVRTVVSDTSERLVRDEIERIKSKTET